MATIHKMAMGIRDGRSHCTCGWKSELGETYATHAKDLQSSPPNIIAELENLYEGMGWFGVQGNLISPDNAWAGVSACRSAIMERIKELKLGMDNCESYSVFGDTKVMCDLQEGHEGEHVNSARDAVWK